MDSTNSSQPSHPVDHGVQQNVGHFIIKETTAATEQGAAPRADDGNDRNKGKENGGQDAADSTAGRTNMSDGMSMSSSLDHDAQNMPCGSCESWMGINEPFPEAGAEAAAADDNDSGLATGSADADEKLRAVLRAMQRRGRPRGLTVAAADSEPASGSAAGEDWGDVRVLDCSDEVWEQILGDSAGEPFATWEDGRTEGDMKS
ncbi:hypothetical protein E4U53_002987 [Claviceps sorghi]|nr:hypothetical protein E4U53_002987 [Claviceps sorghi]